MDMWNVYMYVCMYICMYVGEEEHGFGGGT
jgi:hypothetical protein